MSETKESKQQNNEQDSQAREGNMTFWDHISELRVRIFRSALWLAGGTTVGLFFSKQLFRVLRVPYDIAYEKVYSMTPELIALSPLESFMVYLRLGLLAGLFIASPLIFYELWKFLAPALHEHERKKVLPFVASSTLFFVGGAVFGYFLVFPKSFEFLLGYTVGENIETKISMQEYFYFAALMLVGFGLSFELPLLGIYLVYYRVLKAKQLLEYWRGVVVSIFAASMILTPGTDVFSMVMMATPMLILYGFIIVLAWFLERRTAQAGANHT